MLAYTVLRADEQVTGAERIYLAQLANLLGLDPATVAKLETDTGQRIDALGDQGAVGRLNPSGSISSRSQNEDGTAAVVHGHRWPPGRTRVAGRW